MLDSFDLKFRMMVPCGSFLLLRLQAIQCQSNMHASEYDVTASISDVLILEVQQFNMSAAACTFLIWKVA